MSRPATDRRCNRFVPAYDPDTDTWRLLPDSALSPRATTVAWTGDHLVAADYLGATATYDPTTDRWQSLPDLPQDPGECQPHSARADNQVFVHACRTMATYNPTNGRWRDTTHQPVAGWWAELEPAGPAVIVLAKDVPSGNDAALAYRPRP